MNLSERNQRQIAEALSETNRYYFGLKYGREAFDNEELLMYYAESGGGENFARKLAKEETQQD